MSSHLVRLRVRPRLEHPRSIESTSASTTSDSPPIVITSRYPKASGDRRWFRISRQKSNGPKVVALLRTFLRLHCEFAELKKSRLGVGKMAISGQIR